jgi:hypothetical protein
MDALRFLPPFTYSYQCGSTLLTTYLPVYMYSTSLQLISLLSNFLLIAFSSHSTVKYPEWFQRKFAGIYWPHAPLARSSRLIKPYQIISSAMNQMILLLSFGLCSPVLGFYIAFCLSANLSFWLVLIGRFVSLGIKDRDSKVELDDELRESDMSRVSTLSRTTIIVPAPLTPDLSEARGHHHFFSLLEQQVQLVGVRSALVVCQWPIFWTSCLFVTLLGWDMVGDQVGWYRGLWVPFGGVAMLLVLWFWEKLLARWLNEGPLSFSSYFSSPSHLTEVHVTSSLHHPSSLSDTHTAL